ncbi:hypothetical protein [Ammoniphilus sp. CFH 90114]|uniref:hypothetical protein n=1 Tax=Ammoniphilus sp. CFH 90114 TaxID=2493665 RepID=UPI00100FB892|nr:hypothetical protein [Ammoniphilus sp. CFH 90114]RXT02846.1 hypothetical protein EIZ39_24220 [Ammoniphilus sp. CFH 90114]
MKKWLSGFKILSEFWGSKLSQSSQQEEQVESKSTLDQVVQGIEFQEQLKIIHFVNQYMEEYIIPKYEIDQRWVKGYMLPNEIWVTEGEKPVYRANMELFFQDKETQEKKSSYKVSLVRFAQDQWRVFHLKEQSPL